MHYSNINSNKVGNTTQMMNHYQSMASPGRPNMGSSPMGKRDVMDMQRRTPNRNGPGEPRRNLVSNMMSYRDPPKQKRESTPPREPYRPTFEDFDDPPSPTGSNYDDDRIQNDLLDEICSDIGIKDATDLDIFDFDANTDQYIINPTRLPDDLDCIDQTMTFGEIKTEQYGDFGMPVLKYQNRYGDNGQTALPINQRSVSDEVKSAANQEFISSDCLASPTVSSTCPGSQSNKSMPRPPSQGSGVGSPVIHSTNIMDDMKDIKQLKKELQNSIKLLDSPAPSPIVSCQSNRPPSVECLGRFGPPSVNNDRSDVSSTTPNSTDESSSCMMASPDKKPSYSKATTSSSCQMSASAHNARPKTPLFSSCSHLASKPQMATHQLPSPHDTGYSSGNSVGTGSHYNSNLDSVTKDKVYRFLDSQPPEMQKPVITSDQSSTSSSPPQHAAKRARIINGNELLEEMRNRYAFTKGADMYVPNRHPNIDGSYSDPQERFQAQFSNTSNTNYAESNRSCMKSHQPQQFSSCAVNNVAQGAGVGVVRPPSTNAYVDNSQLSHDMQPPPHQPYMPQGQFNQSYNSVKQESSQYPSQQGAMYGSCPNLGPQGQYPGGAQQQVPVNRPYSPMNRPPVAQPRMSHGYPQNQASYNVQYETPATTPLPMGSGGSQFSANRNMSYPTNTINPSCMNQTAPTTPLKCPVTMQGENQNYHSQWNQNQNNNGQYAVGQYANDPNMQMNPAMRDAGPMHGQMRGQYPGNQQINTMQQPGTMNMQMRPGYNSQPMSSPQANSQQMMGPNNMCNPMQSNAPQMPMQHVVPRTIDTQTPVSQQGFMQSIITDRSSSFRSHPLFPLLRDLIIADMNFHTPTFPFQLIANLPADFDRLLQNYLQRNPPANTQPNNDAVQGVIMDALKYAHSALIGKIQQRKQKEGYEEPAKPLSAIEDFCERFDRAVKNSMVKPDYEGPASPNPFGTTNMCPPSHPAPHPHHDAGMMNGHVGNMMAMPMRPQHLAMNNIHSQSYQDITRMGPGPSLYPHNPMGHPHLSGYPERRANSLPSTPRKSIHGRIHDTASETNLSRTGSDKNVSSGTGTGKSKVLPKEAVALMMDWLRKHQDNPYPNDDEKELLIQKTKLTINQINYWFTNARRRILPKWALQRYMEQQEKQKQLDQQQQIGTASTVH